MKLSNALALARSPNPCFVVIPPEQNSVDEKPWRAAHFWDWMIAQTLKRARDATSKGVSESSFNKKSITFKFTEGDRFAPAELLPWMECTIRTAGLDYTAVKSALRDTLGFDAERLVGTIQFAPMRSIEELIDHQLGLTPTIPIGGFELRDRRFGIDIPMPMPVPIPTGGKWVGTLHAHPKPCVMRLGGPDGVEMELAAELIASGLPGLPIEQCKFRVKADFLDLVLSVRGEAHFKLNFNTADKKAPALLERLTRLMSWSGKGQIDIQVSADDKKLFGGTADIDPSSDGGAFERLTLLIEPLVQLSSHLRQSCPQISIEDIDAADEHLVALHGFLTSPDMKLTAHVDSDALPVEVDNVVTYGFLDVGTWRFGALARWKCSEQSIAAGTWNLRLHDRRIVERYAFEASDSTASDAFRADFERLAAAPGVLAMDDNAVARLIHLPSRE